MPRSSQHTQSRSFKTSTPAPIVKPFQPTLPMHMPPAPSFGQLIKEGIGFGAGQAVAHRAVAAILGPTTAQTVGTPTQSPSEAHKMCVSERNLFETCLRIRSNENNCDNELLSYKQCIELTEKSQ